MASQTEELFNERLKDIFIGEELTGDSGYVNLMNIKSRYFDDVFEQLNCDIDEEVRKHDNSEAFRKELYDKLYSFLKKYFSDSGSIYFTYTPLNEKVYEQVYDNQEDVSLFWKTHMLYYVKTDTLWENLTVESKTLDGSDYDVKFDVSEMDGKTANEKTELEFELADASNVEIKFSVSQSSYGMSNNKIDEIRRDLKRDGIVVDNDDLRDMFATFRKQNEVDFFINKDAEGFLKSQFDQWVKQYLLDDDSVFDADRVSEIKSIQRIAYSIIDFVSQFEDELAKIWNKPKFARDSHYIVTLNKIVEEDGGWDVLQRLSNHGEWGSQTAEWVDLDLVDDSEVSNLSSCISDCELPTRFEQLPLDTAHFDGLEIDVIELFDDLDGQLDGRLIHSENYQALVTLEKRWRNRVDAIYIDPPYNSPSSEIEYRNNYAHSSWLSLMSNRLEVGKQYLTDDGGMVVAIDENEQERLGLLLNDHFPEYDRTCVTVVHNPRGVQGKNFSYNHEYAYFVYPEGEQAICRRQLPEDEWDFTPLRNWGGESRREDAKKCFYPIYVDDGEIVEIGEVPDNSYHPPTRVEEMEDGTLKIWPIDSNGVERKWRYSVDSIQDELFRIRVESNTGTPRIKIGKHTEQFKTTWVDSRYDASTHGTRYLTEMGLEDFTFPKSIHTVVDSLYALTKDDPTATVLDYFGGSGTTAEATLRLNEMDDGDRDFLLVEMDTQFYDVVIPRMKNVLSSPDITDGGFIKYYELEQYEEVLRNCTYRDSSPFTVDDEVYEQYVFLNDEKFIDALTVNDEDGQATVDLSRLYDDVDVAETLANLKGKGIAHVAEDSVTFDDGERVEYDELTVGDVKPLIWW